MNHRPPSPRLVRSLVAASIALALSTAAGTLFVRGERARLLATEGERLGVVAQAMSVRLEDGLRDWLADVRALSRTPALVAAAHDPTAAVGAGREVLDALQRRSPEYAWIGIIRPSGVVATGAGGLLEGVDISHRPIFQGGVSGPFLGDIHQAVLLERLLRQRRPDFSTAPLEFVDVAVPINGGAGVGDGVAAIHVDWQWAADARGAVLAAFAGAPASDILVLDATGRVLLGYGSTSAADDTWLAARAVTRPVAGHPGLGWSVVARREAVAVLEPLGGIRSRIMVVTLVVTLGTFLGAALLGGNRRHPSVLGAPCARGTSDAFRRRMMPASPLTGAR